MINTQCKKEKEKVKRKNNIIEAQFLLKRNPPKIQFFFFLLKKPMVECSKGKSRAKKENKRK